MIFISDGRLMKSENGKDIEMRSQVVTDYIAKVREAAERNEWKKSGENAMFTGAFEAGSDPASRVAAVRSRVNGARECDGGLIYSLNIDNVSGIYRRTMTDGESEGIVISSGQDSYGAFDLDGDNMTVSVSFAGESHIGVLRLGTTDCRIMTEGRTCDTEPVWSKRDRDVLYFTSAGIAIKNNEAEEKAAQKPESYEKMLTKMFTAAESNLLGPSSVCRLSTYTGEMDEILSDENTDYLHPQSASDGSLFYIKRPYKQETPESANPLGCLADLVLFPVRMIMAIIGFFNVFSMKYSGKTIRRGDVKTQDEAKTYIDGNLINAEKELKANTAKGEKNPGIIPRSWELHRLSADGSDKVMKKGVVAYLYDDNSGDLLVSNGSCILKITPDGKEEKVSSCKNVTRIVSF